MNVSLSRDDVIAPHSPAPRRRGQLLLLLAVAPGDLLRGQNPPRLQHGRLLGAPLFPAVGPRLRRPLLLLQLLRPPPAQLLHGRLRHRVARGDGRGGRGAGAPGPQSAPRMRGSAGLVPGAGRGLRWHRGPLGLPLQGLTQVRRADRRQSDQGPHSCLVTALMWLSINGDIRECFQQIPGENGPP